MPSRKKAKGKARKAAKEAKAAKEEESRAVVTVNQRQEESVEAQLQRLIINAASPKICTHGCPSLSADEEKIFEDFINAYIDVFRSQNKVAEGFIAAFHATKDEYSDVYSSIEALQTVISLLLGSGTQMILHGDNSRTQLYAMLAFHFEEWVAVEVRKTKCSPCLIKLLELLSADDHTLVSFYRKRVPCSCLDKKYKEVKSVKKMGVCCNKTCSLPERKVERSKMFSCARCGVVNSVSYTHLTLPTTPYV